MGLIPPGFSEVFTAATGHAPWPYQEALSRQPCSNRLIDVPTGCGKTAAVILAWLYRGTILKDPDCPRRLVFCLPMRTLVDQSESAVRDWLEALGESVDALALSDEAKQGLRTLRERGPIVLMGGAERSQLSDWHLHPDEPAILIGTQDMLLSRALNRGYGESRFRWPISFGLLNSDCLWVFDETQLLGVGVETSAQLQAFRQKLGTLHQIYTWWMSATLDNGRLDTVDFASAELPATHLGKEDEDKLGPRLRSPKALKRSRVSLSGGKQDEISAYIKALAAEVKDAHTLGSLTLVVLNRVHRAQSLYDALRKQLPDSTPVRLIHSRFRPAERREQLRFISSESPEGILIATQAIEAGVDLSARLLITELAPWSSMVQRAGRCNRKGDYDDAQVVWIDLKGEDKQREAVCLPYDPEELDRARRQLETLSDFGLETLRAIRIPEPEVVRPVIRRKDLIELFDTTPDLLGSDLDISRFVRDGDDSDVQVFFRELPEAGRNEVLRSQESPTRDEICRVSIKPFASWFGKARKRLEVPPAYRWDHLEGQWMRIDRPVPGETYLLDPKAGGYDAALGWTGEPRHKPQPILNETPPDQEAVRQQTADTLAPTPEGHGDDPQSTLGQWISLPDHTQHVQGKLAELLYHISLPPETAAALETAAKWHDVGKAHPVFQRKLGSVHQSAVIWAKSGPRDLAGDLNAPSGEESVSPAEKAQRKQERQRERAFRHELASALAWLASDEARAHPQRDLIAYLVASHHGKVRLSLRSLPGEPLPDSPETDPDDPLFARGVWHGDELPELQIGDRRVPPLKLDLHLIRAGEYNGSPSWLERVLHLRDDPDQGPFRLATLEAILRAADMAASKAEAEAAPATSTKPAHA